MTIAGPGKSRKTKQICRIGARRQVVLPKRMFEELELNSGDFVEVSVENGDLRLRPKRLVDVGEQQHEPFGTISPYRCEADLDKSGGKRWKPLLYLEV